MSAMETDDLETTENLDDNDDIVSDHKNTPAVKSTSVPSGGTTATASAASAPRVKKKKKRQNKVRDDDYNSTFYKVRTDFEMVS